MSGQPVGPVGRIVATNLRRYRTGQGHSLTTLAERTGLHASAIQRIEAGQRRADADDLVQLAKALNLDVTALLIEGAPCTACNGVPPAGFQCRTCGATT